MLFFASLVLLLPGPNPVWAQQPSLPAVNLGDTSFLAAIAYLGWVVELIGQGVHDNKTANNTGQVVPGSTDVNSGAALTHIAWLSQGPLLIIGCQLERPGLKPVLIYEQPCVPGSFLVRGLVHNAP
jgi:hypothetical protein